MAKAETTRAGCGGTEKNMSNFNNVESKDRHT